MNPDKGVIVIPPMVYPEGTLDVCWKEHFCTGVNNWVIRPVGFVLCPSCGKPI